MDTYRHRVSGRLGQYSPQFAAEFADVLELVDEDAKPLAYTSISQEAIDELQAQADQADPQGIADPVPTTDSKKATK